jgi:mRNA interferase MazF
LKRGEIWTVAGGPDYAGKPRPAIILQSDKFDVIPSVAICLLTGAPVVSVYARFQIAPSDTNGLQVNSQAMIDKISTVSKSNLERRIGRLEARDVSRLNQHVALFLGLAE